MFWFQSAAPKFLFGNFDYPIVVIMTPWSFSPATISLCSLSFVDSEVDHKKSDDRTNDFQFLDVPSIPTLSHMNLFKFSHLFGPLFSSGVFRKDHLVVNLDSQSVCYQLQF